MAVSYTPNANLGKQTDKTEKFSIDVLNSNSDKIDAIVGEIKLAIQELDERVSNLENSGEEG